MWQRLPLIRAVEMVAEEVARVGKTDPWASERTIPKEAHL